jgi:hypothetical protein
MAVDQSGPRRWRATGLILAVFTALATLGAGPVTAASAAVSPAGPDAQLTQAFEAARHLPGASVGGLRAGSVHVGEAAGAEWAIATFVPSASASAGKLATVFQDGAATGVFHRSGGTWRLTRTGPYGCAAAGLPAALRASWHLTVPANCSAPAAAGPAAAQQARRALPAAGDASRGQAIARVALAQVGVTGTPSVASFAGVDCNPYSTMVAGFSANSDGCGFDQHFRVQDENEEWCADFNKWVWQQAGITAGMNTLNAAASSFYAWAQQQGQTPAPDSGTPQAGDSIAFFGPGTVSASAYADHVGVVTSVNADGTINMVNGDFLGAGRVSVEYNTNLDLATWPAAEWGAGEQWVIVTPPTAAQPAAPQATVTGPHTAVTGTTATFRARASAPGGTVSQYYWTFGDGRSGNSTAGSGVSHVYAETGTYTATVTVTSSLGTTRTLTWDVTVNGASSAVASAPSTAVWYATVPVDQYLFVRSAGGLAADEWDGASWLQVPVPGQPATTGPIAALSYPDPAVSEAMTPHAWFRAADGALAETWLGASGWVTQDRPGQPAAGSAIVAADTAAGPAVFYTGAGGKLAETTRSASGWTASTLPSRSTRPATLALAVTTSGPVLFSTGPGGLLQATSFQARPFRTGPAQTSPAQTSTGGRGGWVTSPLPGRPASGSSLAAVTTAAGQPRVFFTTGTGGLAAATRAASGRWSAAGLPGRSAPAGPLAATSYLIPGTPVPGTPPASSVPPGSEPPGTLPEGTIGTSLGQEVFYLTGSGTPAVTYAAPAGGWHTATLPGPAAGIIGADSYPVAGLPSQLFITGSGGAQADRTTAGADPAGGWSATPLPSAPATMADRVVLYAATADDATAAQAAAGAAGLPGGQVTRSFATAWADTLSGSYLVIAVGGAATAALDYNQCGWDNPSTAVGGSTPFFIVAGPLATLPGADAYESGTAAAAAQTQARSTDLAYYAVHGSLPAGVTALPAAASPQRVCSGSPS